MNPDTKSSSSKNTNSNSICNKRLKKELIAIQKEPITEPTMYITPNESNINEIHYVIDLTEEENEEGEDGKTVTKGSGNSSPYKNGIYYGKLIFPKEYPLKPPSIMMCTPNGRFIPNKRLCLSISDYHPELWNPIWNITTILRGLYTFMICNDNTLGSIQPPTTPSQKQVLAKQSLEYNMSKIPNFSKLFPQYIDIYKKRKEQEVAAKAAAKDTTTRLVSTDNDILLHRGGGGGDANDNGNNNLRAYIQRLFRFEQQHHQFRIIAASLVAIVSIVMALRFL